jgi:hypothetical protein
MRCGWQSPPGLIARSGTAAHTTTPDLIDQNLYKSVFQVTNHLPDPKTHHELDKC